MDPFKHYIAQNMIGKSLYFKCDCIVPLDITGRIIDYEIVDNEIMFVVDVPGHNPIKIGENHPNLSVTETN